ncbi:MAG: hypothetical protein AAF412_04650 [Pseudomonadota bacterium]
MNENTTTACPTCEYENGSSGMPVRNGGIMKCLSCGNSWKEFSSVDRSRTPGFAPQVNSPGSSDRLYDNDVITDILPETDIPPTQYAKWTGNASALFCAALLVGGTVFGNWYLTKFVGGNEEPSNRIEVSQIKLKEQIGRDGHKIITVKGKIENQTYKTHTVPPVAIILRRKDGGEIVRWRYSPAAMKIEPGGNTRFASSIQYDTPVIAYAEAIIE